MTVSKLGLLQPYTRGNEAVRKEEGPSFGSRQVRLTMTHCGGHSCTDNAVSTRRPMRGAQL